MATPFGEREIAPPAFRWSGKHPISQAGQHALETATRLVPTLRAGAKQAEREQRIALDTVAEVGATCAFHALAPEVAGGHQIDYPTAFRLLEEYATGDASLAWFMLTNSAGVYLTSWLPEEGAKEIMANPVTIIAGSPTPFNSSAEAVTGGYRVTGTWSWATGSRNATHFLGAFPLTDEDGNTLFSEFGMPQSRLCYFRADQAIVTDGSWESVGLKATHSGTYTVQDAFVPEHWTAAFPPTGAPPLRNINPAGAVGGHCMVQIGIARHAIEAFTEVAINKMQMTPGGSRYVRDREVVQAKISQAQAMVRSVRAWAYELLDHGWELAQRGEDIPDELYLQNQLHNAYTARVCRDAVQMLFDSAATTAVYQDHALDKCLRDILTANAHMAVQENNLERLGKALLGFPVNLRAGAF